MKRNVVPALALTGLAALFPFSIPAQETPTAVAERQDLEESIRKVNARLDDAMAGMEALQKNYASLASELNRIRDEITRVGNDRSRDAATQESIRQLQKAIETVDEKRLADNKKVLEEFAKIGRALEKPITVPTASAPRRSTNPTTTTSQPSPTRSAVDKPIPEKGYEYTIKDGDRLSKILVSLKGQGIKVSQKQMEDANPGVNWSKLKVGQKIFIPASQP